MPLRTVVLLLLLLTASTAAQEMPDRAGWTDRIGGDAAGGLMHVAEWYDVPVTLLYLGRNYYKADNPSTKVVSLPPMEFERSIADAVGSPGSSVGSLDTWILPTAVFGSHLLYAAARNITGNADMRGAYARAFAFYKVLMYNHIATELIKNTVRRHRPDRSDTKSFFSGHTSTNFVTCTFLFREAADAIDGWQALESSPVLATAAKAGAFGVLYGWAGYVGYSRMADNKHYLTDVLVGAAVGSLIGNLIYDRYFSTEDPASPAAFGAGVIDGTPVLSFSIDF